MSRWYVYGWKWVEEFAAPDIDIARGSAALRFPAGHQVRFRGINGRGERLWSVYVEYVMAQIYAPDKTQATREARRKFGLDHVSRVQSVVSAEVARREKLDTDEDGA